MKKHLKLKIMTVFAAILCFGVSSAWGGDLYVDAGAAENGNGFSWETAYTDLQDALAAAGYENTIHVAKGTYVPGNTRESSFVLDNNLTLLGGYPSGGRDRDPEANPAVLSGEIGNERSMMDNIYHVVRTSGDSNIGVMLDGFTITGGCASGGSCEYCGGILVSDGGQVVLKNVNFENNLARNIGGGLYFSGERLTLNNVYFSGNMAGGVGGGLLFSGKSSLDMNDVIFIGNTASGTGDLSIGRGGGICIENFTALDPPTLGTMANITLQNNSLRK